MIATTVKANDQNLTTKPFKPIKELPYAFTKQIKVVNKEFVVAFGMRLDSAMRDIRNYNADYIHDAITKTKDFDLIFRTPFWIALDSTHYTKFIPELILMLTDTTYIGLENAGGITIWSRMKDNKEVLKQNPLNYQIDDDIFTIAGRASWILKRLTKNEFGIVKPNMEHKELVNIQKQWIKWLNTLLIK
ncbi:MAG: hypothetical protein H6553_13015 [Chitinophagales bacterium]|nr:hypothetical protein [Chitinophagales bacterium]